MDRPKRPRRLLAIIYLAAVFALGGTACRKAEPGPQPPVAEKIKKKFQEFGKTRVDNYYWLRERENPKVVDYLKAENEYLKAVLQPTEVLQEKLYQEIVGRIKQTDLSVPYHDNGYYYYTRFEEGKEYPVYCRKKGSLEAPEEVMLNVNEMAQGYSYYSVGGLSVSSNNMLISFGVDTVSRRKYTLHFKNLATGET